MFWRLIPTFVEVTEEKPVGGFFGPPFWIGLKNCITQSKQLLKWEENVLSDQRCYRNLSRSSTFRRSWSFDKAVIIMIYLNYLYRNIFFCFYLCALIRIGLTCYEILLVIYFPFFGLIHQTVILSSSMRILTWW